MNPLQFFAFLGYYRAELPRHSCVSFVRLFYMHIVIVFSSKRLRFKQQTSSESMEACNNKKKSGTALTQRIFCISPSDDQPILLPQSKRLANRARKLKCYGIFPP